MKKDNVQIGLLVLVCAVLIVFIFSTGVLDTQKVWPSLALDYADGRAMHELEKGDAYGVVTSGPNMNLAPGVYRMKIQVESDGENRIRLTSSNDAKIIPDEFVLQADVFEQEFEFEAIDPVQEFGIEAAFESGSYMHFVNVRFYSPVYKDAAYSAAIILVSMCLLAVAKKRGKLTRESWQATVVIGMTVIFASVPALGKNVLEAWDVQFHAARLMNLADALAAGQFPARVGGFSYNGYGAVTSVFYPDLLLYPFAYMLLGGASITYVINLIRVITHLMMAVSMYLAAKNLLENHFMALSSAVMYTLAPFCIRRMYDSFMLGQMQALGILPLYLLALWEIILGRKEKWPLLVLTFSLLFQTHLMSAVIGLIAAVGMGVLFLPGILRERRIIPIMKASAAILLLNLTRLVPMISLYAGGVNTSVEKYGVVQAALSLDELLAPDNWVGLPILVGVAAFCLLIDRRSKDKPYRVASLCALGGALAMFVSTDLFPWSYAVALTGGMVEVLQFPWRFIVLTVVAFSICAGYGYGCICERKGIHVSLILLVAAVLTVWPYINGLIEKGHVMEFGCGPKTCLYNPEYQIEGTSLQSIVDRNVLLNGNAEITEYEKKGTAIMAYVDAEGDSTISFPLFGFDGYAAELNGERIDWTLGDNNRLSVQLPAGTSGELHIWFEGKTLWRVADAVSLLTAVFLCVYLIRRRKNESVA